MTRYQISGSTITLLGLIVYILTPYQVDSVQSAVFPKIISASLVLFGILIILTSGKENPRDNVRLLDPLIGCFLTLVLAAIIFIRLIGFYPAILLSLPLCLVLFGERSYKKIILFTVITTGLIYLIIDILLGGRLP